MSRAPTFEQTLHSAAACWPQRVPAHLVLRAIGCRKGDTAQVLRNLDEPRNLRLLPGSVRAAARRLLLSQPPPKFHTMSSWTYLTQLHGAGRVRHCLHKL